MAISRKRKHAVAEDQQTSKQTSIPSQNGIKAFAGVSKSRGADNGTKKRKTAHQREATPPPVTLTKPTSAKSQTKRKRSLESVTEETNDEQSHPEPDYENRIFKQFAKKTTTATPRNKRFKNALPPSPAETPSKRAAALFDKLKLGSASNPIPFSLSDQHAGYDTPPDTPDAEKTSHDFTLPKELYELVQLHAAFLTALSLYYAHNGTSSQANVMAVLPHITKSWKKRNVTLDDLRRVLGVCQPQSFFLEDYGKAGICLSRAQPRGRALKRAASYIDEEDLNGRFEEGLQQNWMKWQDCADKENCAAVTFINQLPLAEIVKHESVEKATSLFARGQQRLADLKAGQAAANAEAQKPATEVATEQKSAQAVQNRGSSLLDRIHAKQRLTSSLPAGPTKHQLERKAALHRVEDIARVLDLLAGSKSRCSFSVQVVVQQLQQSLRNPITREEVEGCLEVMAKEVTPGFVSVITSGSVRGVVVSRAQRVELVDLRARVQRALT